MAALPIIMAVAGGASSLAGSQAQEEQIQAAAKQQELQSVETMAQGQAQASSIRSQADAYKGAITSSAAGSGVQVGTGSVLDVLEETAFNIELDAMTVESDARRAAENQTASASSLRGSSPSSVSTLLGAFGSGASGYAGGLQLQG